MRKEESDCELEAKLWEFSFYVLFSELGEEIRKEENRCELQARLWEL